MLPVGVNAPVAGSKISALARFLSGRSAPPMIKTAPLPRSVAVWPALLVVMFAICVNVRVDGSNSSALARNSPPLAPPAIRTFPFGKSVPVCPCLATFSWPTVTSELVLETSTCAMSAVQCDKNANANANIPDFMIRTMLRLRGALVPNLFIANRMQFPE